VTADGRTVLLAMNNPIAGDQRYALYPYPRGCAGERLFRMLAAEAYVAAELVTPRQYVRAFDRRNVLQQRTWSAAEASAAGAALLPGLAGRRVVVLGVQTLAALGWARGEWGVWLWSSPGLLDDHLGTDYCCLPHPSGRCREYNDPTMVALAGCVLLEEYRRSSTAAADPALN
jgi:hypothetical protein